MMAAADEAVEEIYSWIEQRELSAKKLQELADELEALRDKCNTVEVVGSTTAVVGFTSMLIAGVATFCTGGLAAPLVAVPVVSSVVGTTLSVGAKITEHFSSSSTLKEAKKIEEECNCKAKHLQQLFEELKAQSPFTDPDQVDQYVLEKLMVAMAKRSGLPDFNPYVLFDDHQFNFCGQHTYTKTRGALMGSAIITFMGILTLFSFAPSGKKLKLLLAKASEKIIKKLSSVGLKTAIKAGSQVVGGAVGLIFSLPEAIESWKNLIRGNHVTEASESLRISADSLLKGTRVMKRQLNELKTTFDRLKKVKLCIKNRRRTRHDKMMLIQFAIDLSRDVEVKQWMRENSKSESKSKAFCILVDIFYLVLTEVVKKVVKKHLMEEAEIDIVFVAHGAITETLIPSSFLLPFRSIKDVVLYSPWNCAINAYTAYGIASGRILPQHRQFYCRGGCSIPHSGHQPTRLPNNWNTMKDARGRLIPNIMVKPVGLSNDNAWNAFKYLKNVHHFPDRKRVVIPFILPGDVDVDVPFFVVPLVLSLVLFFTNQKATVHLAACLSKISEDTELDVDSLINQYSYTIDKTSMSCSQNMFPIEDEIMYQFLRAVFD